MKDGKYILGIDQSTQGTKALLFDQQGSLLCREDIPHRQIVNREGWVSHDMEEICRNTVTVVRMLLERSGIRVREIAGIGISNQRETTCMWNRRTGKPLDYAVVWQCRRAKEIEERLEAEGMGEKIRQVTGIPLSAYYPACKMAWLWEQHPEADAMSGDICLGTMDSWLIYRLTEDHAFKTDYSNASRTQLFDIRELRWNEELCRMFRVPMTALPEVCSSDGLFGYTTMEGLFDEPVPIHAVLGDSHGALFGQGCHTKGMVKATYGTGSSLMMHTGDTPVCSTHGMAASLAWKIGGKPSYVLEGNLNYTGAVITWMKQDLGLIQEPGESQELAFMASQEDSTYLVPAFSGLGAPYWDSSAAAVFCGMSRTTKRAELVKAGVESIAYQIADLVHAMEQDTGMEMEEIRADGGPTHNTYLMQFQSDILMKKVAVPANEELSGIGAAYVAGIAMGLYNKEKLFQDRSYQVYTPGMERETREKKYSGWKEAVSKSLKGEQQHEKMEL